MIEREVEREEERNEGGGIVVDDGGQEQICLSRSMRHRNHLIKTQSKIISVQFGKDLVPRSSTSLVCLIQAYPPPWAPYEIAHGNVARQVDQLRAVYGD